MRIPLLALLLALSLCAPVAARPWYHPAHAGKSYVNPHLTHARVLKGNVPRHWDDQLVLWTGVVRSHQLLDGKRSQIVLDTGYGEVVVRFGHKVLTLDSDRTGYRVAVKGQVDLDGDRLLGLNGRSVIILAPPTPYAGAARVEDFLAWWVGFHNPSYGDEKRALIASAIVQESQRQGLDPLFLASLIQIESAFHVDAVSRSGAIGLGQLMPFTARGLGVNPHDPRQNVMGAARMIAGLVRDWQRRSQNALALSLASYNAGPSLVRGIGAVPRIPETTNYVYFIGFVHERMTAAAMKAGVR